MTGQELPVGDRKDIRILNRRFGLVCWSSSFAPPLLLSDACPSLPLSSYSLLLLCFAPPCHFFPPSFFSLPADSEFWLAPALFGDTVIQDHHFRVPRDRSQHRLLFLFVAFTKRGCFELFIFFPQPNSRSSSACPSGIFLRGSKRIPESASQTLLRDRIGGHRRSRGAGTAVAFSSN